MKWAAASLVALSALGMPTALQAQEQAFTAHSVAAALTGFGETFFRSPCFRDRRDPPPLNIAVAQMESSNKFRDDEEEAITDWVEEALATEVDQVFRVRPQRRRWELDEMRKQLGESKSLAPADRLDGIIAIRPGITGRTVSVTAYAYANDRLCEGAARTIAVGRINRVPDVPEKFFEEAAGRLPDGGVDRVVVMRPDVSDFGNSIPARIMGRRLQVQLADAISRFFQTGIHAGPAAGRVRPGVEIYADGMDVSAAWQANLHLSRSPQGGIDARVEFDGPGNQPGGIADSGYFAADLLPADSDPSVLAAAEAACRSVRQALDTETDPDVLEALARKNECPRLHDALAMKEKFHRDRICAEDRSRWNQALTGSIATMEAVAATLRCQQVVADAQRDMDRRKADDAAIARLKSEAQDLGPLTPGRTIERHARGDDRTGVWKFEMTGADSVAIRLDDQTADLEVDLRDASWEIVAAARKSGPLRQQIETAGKLKPGTYYVRVAPPAGGHGSAYTLHVARAPVDTVASYPSKDRAASLSVGAAAVRYVLPAHANDYWGRFRVSARTKVSINLAWSDPGSDLRLYLENRNGALLPWPSDKEIVWTLEAGDDYWVHVNRARGTGAVPFRLSVTGLGLQAGR